MATEMGMLIDSQHGRSRSAERGKGRVIAPAHDVVARADARKLDAILDASKPLLPPGGVAARMAPVAARIRGRR